MNRDQAERQFHAQVKDFGFKGKVNGDDVWSFEVQIPRKCVVVFKSNNQAEAVQWAKDNARNR